MIKKTPTKKSHLRENQAIRAVVKTKKQLDRKGGSETVAFGSMLRALRLKKGMGLRRLASRIHVSPSYVSNVERGHFPPPSEEKLRLIARELNQKPDRLLTKAGASRVIDPFCGTGSFVIKSFGATLRGRREQKGIGLRQLARKIGISPSYLSNVETGKFPPPAEEALCLIARELDVNPDEWLAQAGKVRSDLPKIIEKYPREYAALLRSLRNLEKSDFRLLVCGLAQQFDVVIGNPPWARDEVRKETDEAHVRQRIDWRLLSETFDEQSMQHST